MNLEWILLAVFLVALIRGVTKSLTASLLRNLLRLGSVLIAFVITLVLQLDGVFQGVLTAIISAFDLLSLLPIGEIKGAQEMITALASTIVSPILFVIVFLLTLGALRIIILFIDKFVEMAKARRAVQVPTLKPVEVTPHEKTPTVSVSALTEEIPSEEAEATPASANPEGQHFEKTATEPSLKEKTDCRDVPGKAKKKKTTLYPERPWKRAISLVSGVVSGFLLLSVVLMPMFYTMSIAAAATEPLQDSDAEDSQIYQLVDVVDRYAVGPYHDSFVASFYRAIGLSELMNYSVRTGGKIVLDDGTAVYADDVLKVIVTHGIDAAMQLTSAKSACADIQSDVEEILSDPVVSSILVSALMDTVAKLELEETEEEDLMGSIINSFIAYYKTADEATMDSDIHAIGKTVGVLAEKKVLASLVGGQVDLAKMMEDEETLGDIVEAISGLSAFGPTVESAFELGVGYLGDALDIPENDAEVYDRFMDSLLAQMVKSDATEYKANSIKYYIYQVATTNNGKLSSSIPGHKMFTSYAAHWEKVQFAFAHASEDKSYGWFTMDISGTTYLYDKNNKEIITITDENRADYRDKISPIAGVINALTLKSSTKQLTRDNLYTILTAYAASASDSESLDITNRILAKEGFVSRAVTVEKMLASTNFVDWSNEEKAADSRLCVQIISDLLGLMDSVGSLDTSAGVQGALDLIDQFDTIGATMDIIQQTSCINELPPLLLEAVVKHEILSQYIKPSIAFQINYIAENNDKSYEDCMNQIAVLIRWAIHTFGGVNA